LSIFLFLFLFSLCLIRDLLLLFWVHVLWPWGVF
jgi:hypothetical protein